MGVPIIAWGFLALGTFTGGVGGYLIRQPEVNRLKAQVAVLQKETKRINGLIDECLRQIESLRKEYKTTKIIHWIERSKAKGKLKGAIMCSYCMKEYLDLEVKFLKNITPLTTEEAQFRQCFDLMLAGTMPNDNSRKVTLAYLRQYIRRDYAAQIDGLIECDLRKTLIQTRRNIDNIDPKEASKNRNSPVYEKYTHEKNKKLESLAIKEYDKHAKEFAGFDVISGVFTQG